MQPLVREQGQLVRSGRALVRHAEDADDETTFIQRGERVRGPGNVVGGIDVERVLTQAGHRLGNRLGAERDDERVGLDALTADLGAAGRGVDRGDVGLHDLDVFGPQRRKRPHASFHPLAADDGRGLAEPHHEMGAAVDQDDLVLGVQEPAHAVRGGDAAESTAEDQNAVRHGALP